ncbi:unnamed protein product [Mytilus coruscus]|uniref:Uncharacterized protein n=1 Tax=Mytilus coruscus TaxID=42192 RepID=A0A6J8ENP8_MYTCO|nr:unnamed protein product [Mytilus coruscus]
MDEKLNLSVYSVPTLHCLLITQNVYDIKPITYCERKLKKIDCDVMVSSIIFRVGNLYIQWTCNHSQSYNGKMYFRVISLKDNKDVRNAFPKTEIITHTTTKNNLDSVSQAGKTTTFNQNDSILYATTTTTYGRTTQTGNEMHLTAVVILTLYVYIIDVCIKLSVGVAAFLGSIIVVLFVVVSNLRRKLRKASYTCLTVRRDQNIYNETTHHLSDAGHYLEIVPLAEMSASVYRPTGQQNIDQIQHVDTS